MRYQKELAETCANMKIAGIEPVTNALEDVTAKLRGLQKAVADLEKLIAKHDFKSLLDECKHRCEKVLPAMLEVRTYADALECVVADDLWALPSYQEMLFIK